MQPIVETRCSLGPVIHLLGLKMPVTSQDKLILLLLVSFLCLQNRVIFLCGHFLKLKGKPLAFLRSLFLEFNKFLYMSFRFLKNCVGRTFASSTPKSSQYAFLIKDMFSVELWFSKGEKVFKEPRAYHQNFT